MNQSYFGNTHLCYHIAYGLMAILKYDSQSAKQKAKLFCCIMLTSLVFSKITVKRMFMSCAFSKRLELMSVKVISESYS
jgi:hypothetical protein